MAFVGIPVVKLVTDRLVRITGVSLAAEGGTGVIGLFEKTVAPDIRLPAGFQPRDFDMPDVDGKVTLQDSIQCRFVYVDPGSIVNAVSVVKAGTTPEDFSITMENSTLQEGGTSGLLEIYIGFH